MAKVGLVFLPVWGAGHLISMLEVAKRLLLHTSNNHFSITVLLIKPHFHGFSSSTNSYIQSLSSSGLDIHFQDLPHVEAPRLQDTEGVEDFVSLFLQLHKPHVKAAISSSSIPVVALFIDFFATTVIDVAVDLGIPAYIYFTSTALMLGLMLHLPTLHDKIPVEFDELQENIELPGISAIPPLSMPTPLLNKKNRCYTWFVYHGRRFREAKGIIINTFEELEPEPLAALVEGRFVPDHPTPPVYPIGPVLYFGDMYNAGSDKHECIKWLDQHPLASVVFLCFGSMGCFDALQVREMAAGLERSGHRFLWSLRSPPTGNVPRPTDTNMEEVLPDGFLERTKERGMVWPSWVPQTEILSHRAVGGFVTHCGWNSCLESLWFGVPMLAWPLYAEQHLNDVEMVRDLGVAVGLKVDRKGGNFVGAEELERGVRCLMGECEEGKRVKKKVEEMRLASRKAIGEGGSSNFYLERLAGELRHGGVPHEDQTK